MSYPCAKLKNISIIKTGKLDSNAAVKDGKYPFFTCDPNTLSIDEWAYDTEAVLLAGNNASGNYSAKYYSGKFNAYQRTYIIESVDQNILNVRFLASALNQQLQLLKNLSSGSTTKFLTIRMLHNLDIPLPNINIQHRIADILSAYDDLIENNRKQIKLLEEAAQRLYKEWFVDLRFPGHEHTKIVDGVPEGWERKPIDDVFIIKYGKTLPTSKITKSGAYPVYGANGVIGFYKEKNCDEYITVITSRGNGSGDVLRTYHKEAFITNNSFTVIPIREYDYCKVQYTYYLMKSLNFKSICTGSAQPQLTNSSISTLILILPAKEIINVFCDMAEPFFYKINILMEQIERITQARDRLLPKLMSGEVEV